MALILLILSIYWALTIQFFIQFILVWYRCVFALSFQWFTKSVLSSRYSFCYCDEHRYQSYSMETNGEKWQEYGFWWWKRRHIHIQFFLARMKIYTITECNKKHHLEYQFIVNSTLHLQPCTEGMKKSCEHTCWIFKCYHCGVHKH